MAAVRTFLSFDPPPEIRADIKAVQDRFRSSLDGVAWVRPENFHSTITFLGDVEESLLPLLLPEFAAVALRSPAFDVSYEGLGVFPNRRRPNVLWVGCVAPGEALFGLKEALDAAAARRGIVLSPQQLHPHVTLGRVRTERAARDLIPMLETLTFEPRRARIEGIRVMKSVLSSHGAAYTALATNPLYERTTNRST
jgi:2'-5' RNA ligase